MEGGVVSSCGVQLVFCVCRDAMVLWWGMMWSCPVMCGLFLWESRLVLTFAVWVLCGLGG